MGTLLADTQRLLELLGHNEWPMGVYYADEKPEGGFGPKPGEIFTREREAEGRIDWQNAFGDTFACVMGKVLLARSKRTASWISHEECGCMGGGFYTGMYGPYLETNVLYVTTGIPGMPSDGERYLPSPECMRAFMDDTAPPLAPKKYCIFKALEKFAPDEEPLVVVFFARPEVLTGLHSLAGYAAGHHNAVVAPFSAGCGAMVAWPLAYQQRGEERAVLGGFDPSARKFFKTDELTFSITLPLYRRMLDVMEESALPRETWQKDLKKVKKSMRTWGEGASE
ncbi:MAG: DUF169 domain-containing protein [Desulfovibrionaceae bacterium]|jgi:hypothetical protein|nr:DUF169 domain-containing protein [Desulfovibrionaceae bacterium]